jgi:hypothetical protein
MPMADGAEIKSYEFFGGIGVLPGVRHTRLISRPYGALVTWRA